MITYKPQKKETILKCIKTNLHKPQQAHDQSWIVSLFCDFLFSTSFCEDNFKKKKRKKYRKSKVEEGNSLER